MYERIAVIAHDEDIVKVISNYLRKRHFRVETFASAHTFFASSNHQSPDLLLIDSALLKGDTYDLLSERTAKQPHLPAPPLIILSDKNDENEKRDRTAGANLAGAEYITKPLRPSVLIERVKMLLYGKIEPINRRIGIKFGDITLFLGKHGVIAQGRKVELTSTELRILHLFISKRGWVLTRDKILDHLWGDEKLVLDRTVDVHIKHLRDKLGPAGRIIRSVRGIGYKLEE